MTNSPATSLFNTESQSVTYYMTDSIFFKVKEDGNILKLPISDYPKIMVNNVFYERHLIILPNSSYRSYQYLARIIDGQISLYSIYSTNSDRILMTYYLMRNDQITLVNPKTFRKEMASYFSSNKSLSKSILHRKKTIDNLKEIVDVFNKIDN